MASPDTGLAPDTPPDVALRLIVAKCHADLVKYRAVVLTSRRPVGIHQTRVALRRLRAAFGLFKSTVDGPVVRALSAEAKGLAGECGPARDLHVFMTESVENIPPTVKRIANRLMQTHFERARTALAGARFKNFNSQLEAFIALPPAETHWRLDSFARRLLTDRHAKVLKRGRKLHTLDAERLHRLRIAIKKLRYAADFLQPAFAASALAREQAKAYIGTTTRLQGALGALNDREMAQHMLSDLAMAARPNEDVASALKALGKQASGGEKRRRRKLEEAWKTFSKAECFWQARAPVALRIPLPSGGGPKPGRTRRTVE
jgi:CHAD domain-containing protein